MAESDNDVETRVGQTPIHSIEMGMPTSDGSKPQVKTTTAEGATAEFDDDGVKVHESDKASAQAGKDGSKADGEGGAEGKDGAEAAHDLPAFDANNQEVVQQYTAAYISQDGEPNLDALSAVWFKGASKDASGNWTGALPDDVYSFLDSQGYPKGLVKSVEAGQVALLQQQEQAVYARAGGAENLQKALEWARKGGYTDTQKARYNDLVVKGRDKEAASEQIDLLMQRFNAANPGNGRRAATRVNPQRSVSANAGGSGSGDSGVKGYDSQAEYRADLRKARAENNQALLNETRKRLKASKWYTGA